LGVGVNDTDDLGFAPFHEFVESNDFVRLWEVGLNEVQSNAEGGVDDGGVEEGEGIEDFEVMSGEYS
jgi:hypothetical protein